jgi:hypothetical protein
MCPWKTGFYRVPGENHTQPCYGKLACSVNLSTRCVHVAQNGESYIVSFTEAGGVQIFWLVVLKYKLLKLFTL